MPKTEFWNPPLCIICRYEINGKRDDYQPDCGALGESQCNECIMCLLYCDCV